MPANPTGDVCILGISAYYHDSAAALLVNGQLVAAAQEERFTRKKHDACFPSSAITYCLKEAKIELGDVQSVVFYDKPLLKFDRLLETYLAYAPKGFGSFLRAMPVWLKEKLFLKTTLRRELGQIADSTEIPQLLFSEHHQAHAASAFYPGPFKEAAVLCLDGVGEWATTSAWMGRGKSLERLWEIDFPHSLGLLYSAFTYFCGFKVNSGEYKLMGLAPYGEPRFKDLILDNLLDLKDDGSFRLAMQYFDYCTGLKMTNARFAELFGGPRRNEEAELTQREMDIAASIQAVTEDVVLRLASTVHRETNAKRLCLSGGVALNCVANGRLLREGPFEDIWIQPAAGDAGSAVGAAYLAWHEHLGRERPDPAGRDAMKGAYLGPRFAGADIAESLSGFGAVFKQLEDDDLFSTVARLLAQEQVIGWFQGRMEFGPRALGGRSILADPRSASMQSVMNLKIKYRESFRPFAPSVLEERVSEYFEHDRASPYMLIVAPVSEAQRIPVGDDAKCLSGINRLKLKRSTIPAVTHVDGTARIQTVSDETNPRYHRLLKEFEAQSGCGLLVNTSFNVRGEPIVGTPADAYRCFMRTEMDYLVIENCLLAKPDQPPFEENSDWRSEFELD
ncbi:MAG: carbamoyltransferase [Pseudomonadota bacterium]